MIFPVRVEPLIVPIVGEAGWLNRLSTLPSWRYEQRKLLVVSPHPDDETLAVGGMPLAMHKSASQRYGELDLYLRQCHAERDLESLGRHRKEQH